MTSILVSIPIMLFFPDWFQFYILLVSMIRIRICVPCMWHCSLASCTLLQFIKEFFGCWVSMCVPFINSLIACYSITMVGTIIGIFMSIAIHFDLSETRLFWFWNCTSPWKFLPMALVFDYIILHVTFGFVFRGVPGFATDCPVVFCAVDKPFASCILVQV